MAKQKKMTVDEFFGKLDWEGGYNDLASYGLNPKEISNKKLAVLWQQYLDKYRELETISYQLEELRPQE